MIDGLILIHILMVILLQDIDSTLKLRQELGAIIFH